MLAISHESHQRATRLANRRKNYTALKPKICRRRTQTDNPPSGKEIAYAVANYWRCLSASVNWPESMVRDKRVIELSSKWKTSLNTRTRSNPPAAKKRKVEAHRSATFFETYMERQGKASIDSRPEFISVSARMRKKLVIASLQWLCSKGCWPHPEIPFDMQFYNKARLFFQSKRSSSTHCIPATPKLSGVVIQNILVDDGTNSSILPSEDIDQPIGFVSMQVRSSQPRNSVPPVFVEVISPLAGEHYHGTSSVKELCFELCCSGKHRPVFRPNGDSDSTYYRSPVYMVCEIPRSTLLLVAALLPLTALPQPDVLSATMALQRLSLINKMPTVVPPISTQAHLKASLQSMYQGSGAPPAVTDVTSVTLTISAIQDYCSTLVTKVQEPSEWLKRSGFALYSSAYFLSPGFVVRQKANGREWECTELTETQFETGGITVTIDLLAFCLRRYERERKKTSVKSDISSFLTNQPELPLAPTAVLPHTQGQTTAFDSKAMTSRRRLPWQLSVYTFMGDHILGSEGQSGGALFPNAEDLGVVNPNVPGDFLAMTSFESMCKVIDRRQETTLWSAATDQYTVPTLLTLYCNKKVLRRCVISWHILEEQALWREVVNQYSNAKELPKQLFTCPYVVDGVSIDVPRGTSAAAASVYEEKINWTLVEHAVALQTGVFDQSKSKNSCIAKFISMAAENTYQEAGLVRTTPLIDMRGRKKKFITINPEDRSQQPVELHTIREAILPNSQLDQLDQTTQLEDVIFSPSHSTQMTKLKDWLCGGCGILNLLGFLQISTSPMYQNLLAQHADVPSDSEFLTEQIEAISLQRLSVLIRVAEEQCLRNKYRSFEALASDKQFTTHLQVSLSHSHNGRAFLSAFKYYLSNHPRLFQATHKNLPYESQLINAIATNFARIYIPPKPCYQTPVSGPSSALNCDLLNLATGDQSFVSLNNAPDRMVWPRIQSPIAPSPIALILWRLLLASRQYSKPDDLSSSKQLMTDTVAAKMIVAAILKTPLRSLGLNLQPVVVPAVSFPSARSKKALPPPAAPGVWQATQHPATMGWQYAGRAPPHQLGPPPPPGAWPTTNGYYPLPGGPPPPPPPPPPPGGGMYYFPPPTGGAWGYMAPPKR